MAVPDRPMIAATLALCGISIACVVPLACRADDLAVDDAARIRAGGLVNDARALWHERTSHLEAILSGVRHKVSRRSPDWLHRRSGADPLEFESLDYGDDARLVLQKDRPDGADLLTVRYALDDEGALRAYAGAGMNRAVYFSDGEAFGPSLMNRRNRESSVGAAAEMGAEWRLSENLLLNADLRWFDIDERAYALRSDFGPVDADPVMLGVSVGYRFR